MSNTNLLGAYGGLGNSGLMFRNRIINGGFDIWQRGTSQTSAGYGSDDRWLNYHTGSTKTHSQQAFTLGQTDVPGNPKYFSRTVVSSVAGASNSVTKHHKVESVTTFAGQTATLSFWARADASKNMAVEFYQEFGSGGAPSAGVSGIGVTTIALTTSWKYYTITVNIPSIAGKTLGTNNNDNLQFLFWFDAGSNFNARTNSLGNQSGTFDIAQVQLEAGPVATPFEHRPVGLELSLCQRYYETGYSNVAINTSGATSVYVNDVIGFMTQKRAGSNVTITDYAGNVNKYSYRSSANDDTTNNINTVALTEASLTHMRFRYLWQPSGGVHANLTTLWYADAEL